MQYNNDKYRYQPKIITAVPGVGEIPGISAIQPVQEVKPVRKITTCTELYDAYDYAKKDPYTEKLIANYNDPTELNSYLDALVNRKAVSKDFGDAWGTISTISGTVAVISFIAAAALTAAAFFTGGATAPAAAGTAAAGASAATSASAGAAAALTTAAGVATKVGAIASIPAIPAAAKVTYDYTIKPIAAGRPDYALINSLQNLGETADFAANPVKGLILDGPQGFLKATGLTEEGRVNYDYDTGFVVTDMLLEFISDPMTWLESPANITKFAKIGKAAQTVAEGLIKNIDEVVPTIGKELVDVTKKDKAFKKLKSFLKEMSEEITEAYAKGSIDKRKPILGFLENITAIDFKNRELTETQVKALTERVRNKVQEALEEYIKTIVKDCTDVDIENILKESGKLIVDNTDNSKLIFQNIDLDQLSTHTIRALNNITETTDTIQKFMMRNALVTPVVGAGLDVLKYFDYPMFKWANNNLIQRLVEAKLFKQGVGFSDLTQYSAAKNTWNKGFKYYIAQANPGMQLTDDPLDSFYTIMNTQFMRDKALIRETLSEHADKVMEQATALDAVIKELYGVDFKTYAQLLEQINITEGGIYNAYIEYTQTIQKQLLADANMLLVDPAIKQASTTFPKTTLVHFQKAQQDIINALKQLITLDPEKHPQKLAEAILLILNLAILNDPEYAAIITELADGTGVSVIFENAIRVIECATKKDIYDAEYKSIHARVIGEYRALEQGLAKLEDPAYGKVYYSLPEPEHNKYANIFDDIEIELKPSVLYDDTIYKSDATGLFARRKRSTNLRNTYKPEMFDIRKTRLDTAQRDYSLPYFKFKDKYKPTPEGQSLSMQKHLTQTAEEYTKKHFENVREDLKYQLGGLKESAQNFMYLKELHDSVTKIIIPDIEGVQTPRLRKHILQFITNSDKTVTEMLDNYDNTMAELFYKLNSLYEDTNFVFNSYPELCEQVSNVYKNYLKTLQKAGITRVNDVTVQNFIDQTKRIIRTVQDEYTVLPKELEDLKIVLSDMSTYVALPKHIEDVTGLSSIRYVLTNTGTIFTKEAERNLLDLGVLVKARQYAEDVQLFENVSDELFRKYYPDFLDKFYKTKK